MTQPRPYFGWNVGRGGAGGPQVRVSRLAEEFGNFKIRPNLLYLNSSGIPSRKEVALLRALNPGIRVVYNQNGVFYPAWYSGPDWREKNAAMLAKARGAGAVLFQSRFCKTALDAVTGETVSGEVLYNATPDFGYQKRAGKDRITLAMTAHFGADCEHFLAPAIEAMDRLRSKWRDRLRLVLHGTFREVDVFNLPGLMGLRSLFEDLRATGVIEVRGGYATDRLQEVYSDIDLALHLRDQDACPNAVIERMSLGLGHVFLNSGGTPELVGDSGIPVAAPAGFRADQFFRASVADVVLAIEHGVSQIENLSERARARYESVFSWPQFVAAHRRVFASVLNSQQEKIDGNRKAPEAHL